MAKSKITARAVPSLQLSVQDEKELHELSRLLQHELITQFEEFLSQPVTPIDASRWSHVRAKGDLRAYVERPAKPGKYTSKTTTFAGPQDALARSMGRPRMLVVGTVQGSLDDAMYGSTFYDSPTLQAHWAARHCAIDESAVVATLETPSEVDQFQFLGVTWSAVRSQRDLLTLVRSGMAKLHNGELVGIVLNHSVKHRGFSELREFEIERGTVSTLTVFRQCDRQRVEVWSVRAGDTCHTTRAAQHHDVLAQQAIADLTTAACVGFRRKIQWITHRRRVVRVSQWEMIEPPASDYNNACELCSRSSHRLFGRSPLACRVCDKQACSRCSVVFNLVTPRTPKKPISERVGLCTYCVLDAQRRSTKQIAQEELYRTRNRCR